MEFLMPSQVTYSKGFQQDALQIVSPKVLQPVEIFHIFGDVHPESQTMLHFIICLIEKVAKSPKTLNFTV